MAAERERLLRERVAALEALVAEHGRRLDQLARAAKAGREHAKEERIRATKKNPPAG